MGSGASTSFTSQSAPAPDTAPIASTATPQHATASETRSAEPIGRQGSRRGAPSLPMKRKRNGGRGDRKKRDNRKSQLDPNYVEEDERQSAAFADYYRTQAILNADELNALLTVLASPLPSSFRVVARGALGDQILAQLRGPLAEPFANVPGARAPAPIDWVPGGRAWIVSAPRQMLRRDNLLAPFHRFLVATTELGGVCRQEAVSMVPPLLLGARQGDAVIDLCAAPGSKTGQIIEALRLGDGSSLARPGLIIANDADIKRCWMLAHQLKRFGASQLVVTHHDAQFFPKVRLFDRVLCDVPCSGDGTLRKAPDIWRRWNSGMGMGLHRLQVSILFRGIELLKPGGRLVYSTCSFNPIENEAVVAAALLKFGPEIIELVDVSDQLPELKRRRGVKEWKVPNLSGESVPRRSQNGEADTIGASNHEKPTGEELGQLCIDEVKSLSGKVEIEKSPLPGWYTSYNQVRMRRRRKVVRTMFPPTKEQFESGLCPLERCWRLVPIDQDTGGFFVAVFHKKLSAASGKNKVGVSADNAVQKEREEEIREMKKKTSAVGDTDGAVRLDNKASEADVAENEKNAVQKEGEDELREMKDETSAKGDTDSKTSKAEVVNEKNWSNSKSGKAGRTASRLITDDPLIGVENLNLETLLEIADYFGLNREECRQCLMTRGGDGNTFKKVVLVSPTVREVLRLSLGAAEANALGSSVRRGRLRVVHAGVTMLERTSRRDCQCPFRIVSDGACTLAACMQKRVVCIGGTDFAKLVNTQSLQISTMSQRSARRDMDALSSGSTLVVDKKDGEIGVVWKARHSIALLIGKMERSALAQRVAALESGRGAHGDASNGDVTMLGTREGRGEAGGAKGSNERGEAGRGAAD